jgi:hypothetical protein
VLAWPVLEEQQLAPFEQQDFELGLSSGHQTVDEWTFVPLH